MIPGLITGFGGSAKSLSLYFRGRGKSASSSRIISVFSALVRVWRFTIYEN